MTSQAHHGKVRVFGTQGKVLKIIQSVADGEFARVKDKYSIHLTRRQNSDVYLEVKDSTTFSQFGNENLKTPGPRANIEQRQFFHLDEEFMSVRASNN